MVHLLEIVKMIDIQRKRVSQMITWIFVILMVGIFGKLIGLAFKMTWGITKILLTLVFLPVILIGLVIAGLISIALPLLVVIGIITLIGPVVKR